MKCPICKQAGMLYQVREQEVKCSECGTRIPDRTASKYESQILKVKEDNHYRVHDILSLGHHIANAMTKLNNFEFRKARSILDTALKIPLGYQKRKEAQNVTKG